MKNTSQEDDKDEIKESFCPVCIAAIPLAFSVSTGVGAAYEDEEYINNRRNTIILWSSVVGVISIIVIVYFIFFGCSSCK